MIAGTLNNNPCSAAALQRGEMDALTCYCFRYLKSLSRYAQFLLKDKFIAEDLATKSLEKLWNHRSEMIDNRAVHTFLRKTIYVEVCDWLHQQILLNDSN